mmetsp:Transcript_14154/g.35100  ORF Transcript_14154/g.35100 Transcript_14154/m.35100 type:complete len:305 (-) Transcript_14154:6100-7014(-)
MLLLRRLLLVLLRRRRLVTATALLAAVLPPSGQVLRPALVVARRPRRCLPLRLAPLRRYQRLAESLRRRPLEKERQHQPAPVPHPHPQPPRPGGPLLPSATRGPLRILRSAVKEAQPRLHHPRQVEPLPPIVGLLLPRRHPVQLRQVKEPQHLPLAQTSLAQLLCPWTRRRVLRRHPLPEWRPHPWRALPLRQRLPAEQQYLYRGLLLHHSRRQARRQRRSGLLLTHAVAAPRQSQRLHLRLHLRFLCFLPFAPLNRTPRRTVAPALCRQQLHLVRARPSQVEELRLPALPPRPFAARFPLPSA